MAATCDAEGEGGRAGGAAGEGGVVGVEWWPLYPAGVERWPLYPAVGEGGAAGVECLERWPLYVFLGSATVCLGSSTVYHFFGTANEKWEIALRNVDYGDLVFG